MLRESVWGMDRGVKSGRVRRCQERLGGGDEVGGGGAMG